jgi:hypothetical protein
VDSLPAILGTLVPFGVIAMVIAIVLVPRYLKSRERIQLQQTLQAAIQAGQPLPPEVVEAITSDRRPAPSPQRDVRTGVIWLAVAIGLAAFGVAAGMEDPDASYWMIGTAAFPGFIGVAFIVLGVLGLNKKQG